MTVISASDGTELYAEVHGEGVPIVFSCAFATTCENWRSQVEPLVAAGARVILWDFRAHGRSGVPDSEDGYSMAHVVDDLGRILDWAAPGEAAVLAGLSFGGLASLHYARLQPERVRALVLVGSGPGFKKAEAQERWQAQVEKTAQILAAKGCQALTTGRGAATAIGRNPELPAAVAAGRAIAAQDPIALGFFGRLITGPAESVIDDLPNIKAPSLVIVGEEDAAFSRAAEVMEARLPRARLQKVPDAGHIVNIEAESVFNRAVIEFLAQLSG